MDETVKEGGQPSTDNQLKGVTGDYQPVAVSIEKDVLSTGRVALFIALGAFLALVATILIPPILNAMLKTPVSIGFDPSKDGSAIERFFGHYTIHMLLTIIAIVTLIAGNKIVKASGASPDTVIPPQDYPLLGPLVASNKSEAIGLYIKLSGLRGSTGFFTRLGLTGLPLATIALTITFSLLALISSSNTQFFDLAKLTLGAFIGSFVQGQVERRGNEASTSAEVKLIPAKDK